MTFSSAQCKLPPAYKWNYVYFSWKKRWNNIRIYEVVYKYVKGISEQSHLSRDFARDHTKKQKVDLTPINHFWL